MHTTGLIAEPTKVRSIVPVRVVASSGRPAKQSSYRFGALHPEAASETFSTADFQPIHASRACQPLILHRHGGSNVEDQAPIPAL